MPFKPNEILSKLLKIGFVKKRQSGSHIILRHPDGRQTYISIHTKDIPEGTFKAILKQASITLEEFKNIWFPIASGLQILIHIKKYPFFAKFPFYNPYHYSYNNPVSFKDPTGFAP